MLDFGCGNGSIMIICALPGTGGISGSTFFERYFIIQPYKEIWHPEHEQANRLFLLQKPNTI